MSRNTKILTTLALLVLVLAGPSSADPPDPDLGALTTANTAFALDLYEGIRAQSAGNLALSPLSISTALAMSYAGARGETAAEMGRTLRFGTLQDAVHPAFGALRASLESADCADVRLRTAAALWSAPDILIRDAYLALCEESYGAAPGTADFAGDPEVARAAINAWASDATESMVPELLPPGAITPNTALVLSDAIYFRGLWETPFDPRFTRDRPFHTPGGDVTAPTMAGEATFGHYEEEGLQVLEMDYGGDRLSMIIFLPSNDDGLAALEASLTPARLDHLTGSFTKEEIHVSLPRFRIDSSFELARFLATLGMPTAFSSAADFTGISPDGGLSIDRVFHGAAIEVNEEGTEAAAATAVVKKRGIGKSFRADRPFLYLIRDRRTGALLFIGRVVDPTA